RMGADLLLLVPKLQLGNTTVQKLQLRLHEAVPKLELGNEGKKIVIQSSTSESSLTWLFSFDVERSMFDVRCSSLKTTQWHKCNPVFHSMFNVRCSMFDVHL
ncbi:MAG: hypothetical protein SWC40_02170, partial [Thermodesulfobacteriota bacterium]|nr:hypothetical protein [Thermodesulfobacteriota bacterium]